MTHAVMDHMSARCCFARRIRSCFCSSPFCARQRSSCGRRPLHTMESLEDFDPEYAALAAMVAGPAQPPEAVVPIPQGGGGGWKRRTPQLMQFCRAKLESARFRQRYDDASNKLKALQTRLLHSDKCRARGGIGPSCVEQRSLGVEASAGGSA